jgi:hypothetical protein
LRAAEVGWANTVAAALREIYEAEENLAQAVLWAGREKGGGDRERFFGLIESAVQIPGQTRDRICFNIGKVMYWKLYEEELGLDEAFQEKCLDFYISSVELQQKAVWLILWYFKQSGMKDVGGLIAKMVWEEREMNLIQSFEKESDRVDSSPLELREGGLCIIS